MTKRYDVFGVGNALLDYQVEVPFDFLERHGITKGSMTLVDSETQQKLIQEIYDRYGVSSIRRTSGGCAANTLAGLSSYGGTGYFTGKIARDDNGNYYRSDLSKASITFEVPAGNSDRTGTCLALITPDAERTMLTNLGIAIHLDEKDIHPEAIQASKIVYIEGYLWDSPSARRASLEAIQMAKDSGSKVAFTYSDSFCVDRYREDFENLTKSKIDILFCNEAEALHATKTKDIQEAFSIIRTWSDVVCTTTGPRGALLSSGGGKEIVEIPTWDVKLVDKLGAGDLFASGMLYGLITNRPLAEAGYLGCFAATRVIQQISARLTERLSESLEVARKGPESGTTTPLTAGAPKTTRTSVGNR